MSYSCVCVCVTRVGVNFGPFYYSAKRYFILFMFVLYGCTHNDEAVVKRICVCVSAYKYSLSMAITQLMLNAHYFIHNLLVYSSIFGCICIYALHFMIVPFYLLTTIICTMKFGFFSSLILN